jgi:hypothetical protein
MNFLSPWFLGGLAALSIPVLIHLINREKKVVVQFPSLMFLHKIPYKSVRRQKIRHLLLLILRCLALALFVAAFARPWFDRSKHAGAAGTTARAVVLLIDRSYSMGYGTRWQTALDKAREIVRAINPQDNATIVFFANEPTAATEPTADRSRLENALKVAKLSSEGTRFAPAIKFATEIVVGSNLPRKDVVLISDFQKAGWAKREELSLPADVTLRTVDVAGGDAADAGVIGVTTERTRDSVRERVTVSARIANLSPAARTVEAALDLGGRSVERKRVTLPPKSAQQVRFAPISVPATAMRGIVSITGDSLAADDRFFFTVTPDEAVSVLVIEPGSARPNQSLYLRTALSIGDKPRFKVDVRTPDAVRPADLEGRSLFILNEAPPPGGAIGARMREAIAGGTGLFIVPGDQDVERWPSDWKSLVPATVGRVVDHTRDAGATIGAVDYTNPVFDIFSAPRSGDFASARVFRYRLLRARGDSGVLAKFEDGAPAMVSGRAGNGRVVVWATSMDASWTDLPMQTVFVPFVHQVGKRVGRYADSRQWFTAGDVLDLSRHAELTSPLMGSSAKAEGDSVRLILEAPSGEKTRLSVMGTNHLATLREQGLYELRGEGDQVGGGRPVAVNVDAAEADLSHLDPQELVAAASATTAKVASGEVATVAPEQQEGRQTLWWYLLLAALFLLAVETVLSNRLSRVSS